MPSVDRVTANVWDEPGWSSPRPWVAVTWVTVLAALVGAAAYLGLRPDAWELYQKDFGCTALTNIDTSYARSRCKPAASSENAQPTGHAKPLGLGGGR